MNNKSIRGITRFLDDQEGEYGEDEILLERDIDLASNLDLKGYTIASALTSEQFTKLKQFILEFIKDGLVRAIGIKKVEALEKKIGKFTIENYHLFADEDHVHEKVFQHIRLGVILDSALPDASGLLEADLSNIVSKEIGHDVRIWLNTCNVRLARPHSSDNNPLHRDVYLPRLRNKINIYLPIAGSTPASALGLIPESHRWSEAKIAKTPNYSTYNGKKFTVPAIVEVSKPDAKVIRVSPKYGEINIFSPYLIHGGGSNPGTETRCSLEVRFCPKRQVLSHEPILPLSKLGVGTIWYGMQWPPENDDWKSPSVQETSSTFLKIINSTSKFVLVDTAPCYRGAESMLSNVLALNKPESLARVVISTKVGEYYDKNKEKNFVDYSIDRIHASLKNSHKLLGDLHIIYMHLTSQLSLKESLSKAIKKSDLYTEMMDIREEGKYGCKLLGVTISNDKLLGILIDENLLPNFDVLQVPAWLVRQQPELIAKWKSRRDSNLVIVNSCVRHKPEAMTVDEAYKSVLSAPFVDVVLCGSRNHVTQSIAIAKKLVKRP